MKEFRGCMHDLTQSESQMTADGTDYADDSGLFGWVQLKNGGFSVCRREKPFQDVVQMHLRNLFHLRPSAIQTGVRSLSNPGTLQYPV